MLDIDKDIIIGDHASKSNSKALSNAQRSKVMKKKMTREIRVLDQPIQ